MRVPYRVGLCVALAVGCVALTTDPITIGRSTDAVSEERLGSTAALSEPFEGSRSLRFARSLQDTVDDTGGRPLESDAEATQEEMNHFIDGPIAKSVAAIFAVTAIVLSFYEMLMHLKYYNRPLLQRQIIRIILIVPIYALGSLMSLLFPAASIYFNTVRDIYEAYCIHSFLALMLDYPGGEPAVVAGILDKPQLKHPIPFCCLPRMRLDHQFIQWCKRGTLQFVFLKPLMAATSLVLMMAGEYESAEWQYTALVIYNLSYTTALYVLLIFYMATKHLLKGFSPVGKFGAVKIIVFATYYQSLLVVAIPGMDSLGSSERWNDWIICVEMACFAVMHMYCFSHKEFLPGGVGMLHATKDDEPVNIRTSNTLAAAVGRAADVLSLKDVVEDAYRNFSLRYSRYIMAGVDGGIVTENRADHLEVLESAPHAGAGAGAGKGGRGRLGSTEATGGGLAGSAAGSGFGDGEGFGSDVGFNGGVLRPDDVEAGAGGAMFAGWSDAGARGPGAAAGAKAAAGAGKGGKTAAGSAASAANAGAADADGSADPYGLIVAVDGVADATRVGVEELTITATVKLPPGVAPDWKRGGAAAAAAAGGKPSRRARGDTGASVDASGLPATDFDFPTSASGSAPGAAAFSSSSATGGDRGAAQSVIAPVSAAASSAAAVAASANAAAEIVAAAAKARREAQKAKAGGSGGASAAGAASSVASDAGSATSATGRAGAGAFPIRSEASGRGVVGVAAAAAAVEAASAASFSPFPDAAAGASGRGGAAAAAAPASSSSALFASAASDREAAQEQQQREADAEESGAMIDLEEHATGARVSMMADRLDPALGSPVVLSSAALSAESMRRAAGGSKTGAGSNGATAADAFAVTTAAANAPRTAAAGAGEADAAAPPAPAPEGAAVTARSLSFGEGTFPALPEAAAVAPAAAPAPAAAALKALAASHEEAEAATATAAAASAAGLSERQRKALERQAALKLSASRVKPAAVPSHTGAASTLSADPSSWAFSPQLGADDTPTPGPAGGAADSFDLRPVAGTGSTHQAAAAASSAHSSAAAVATGAAAGSGGTPSTSSSSDEAWGNSGAAAAPSKSAAAAAVAAEVSWEAPAVEFGSSSSSAGGAGDPAAAAKRKLGLPPPATRLRAPAGPAPGHSHAGHTGSSSAAAAGAAASAGAAADFGFADDGSHIGEGGAPSNTAAPAPASLPALAPDAEFAVDFGDADGVATQAAAASSPPSVAPHEPSVSEASAVSAELTSPLVVLAAASAAASAAAGGAAGQQQHSHHGSAFVTAAPGSPAAVGVASAGALTPVAAAAGQQWDAPPATLASHEFTSVASAGHAFAVGGREAESGALPALASPAAAAPPSAASAAQLSSPGDAAAGVEVCAVLDPPPIASPAGTASRATSPAASPASSPKPFSAAPQPDASPAVADDGFGFSLEGGTAELGAPVSTADAAFGDAAAVNFADGSWGGDGDANLSAGGSSATAAAAADDVAWAADPDPFGAAPPSAAVAGADDLACASDYFGSASFAAGAESAFASPGAAHRAGEAAVAAADPFAF